MRELSGVSFIRALIPFVGLHPHDLIASQRGHLLTQSHWGGRGGWVRASYIMNLGVRGDDKHSGHSNWCPYKRRHTDTEEKPREDGGRDGREAATSPGTPGAPGSWKR